MLVKPFKIGTKVDIFYPTHGRLNVLRRIVGEVIEKGSGKNGPYIKVESNGVFRNLSLKKIVELK